MNADTFVGTTDFNPLPPSGGRPIPQSGLLSSRLFQSTPPKWRETRAYPVQIVKLDISIHSPQVEGDNDSPCGKGRSLIFQSTPPKWRETLFLLIFTPKLWISIHSPQVEGDHHNRRCLYQHLQFQSTPPKWRKTRSRCSTVLTASYFNPLPPSGGRPPPKNHRNS